MRALPFPISRRLRHFAVFSVVLIAIAIATLSLIPNADLPPVSGSDKVKHAIAYAALSAPLTVWIGPTNWIKATLLAVGFGIGLEIAQYLAPTGRSGSFLDALANGIGALSGAGLARLIFNKE